MYLSMQISCTEKRRKSNSIKSKKMKNSQIRPQQDQA